MIAKTGATKSFKAQFWSGIKHDLVVRDAMERVPSPLRNRVVLLLQAVSDPDTEARMKRFAPLLIAEFVPSNKKLAGLAARLRTIGRELEYASELPGFNGLREFAKECSIRAGELATLRPSGFVRHLGYDSFWKSVPAAMLCRELVDSNLLSFGEVEGLVRYADKVHGRTHVRPRRSVERQYKHFMKYKGRGTSPILSAVWPTRLQRLLDLMVRTVPTR